MTRLAVNPKNVQRSQNKVLSAALEKMPVEELQKIVQKLRADLEKAIRFVNEQEEELASQRQTVNSLEDRLRAAGDPERLGLQVELVNEREKREIMEATLIGQRRNLRKREEIFNQHWQVLRRRQGASANDTYGQKLNLKPLLGSLDDRKTEDPEVLEVSKRKSQLRSYVRTLWRKSWLIAGVTGVTTFIALLISANESQVYQGNFYLLVEPITSAGKLSDPSTLARTEGVPNDDLLALDYPTNLAFLQSPGMTSKIAQDAVSKNLGGNFPTIWKDIRENMSVKRIGEGKDATKIFEVTYEGSDPKEVVTVLETAANTFLKYSAEDRQTNIKAGIQFIEKQLPDIQKRLETLKDQQQKLRQENSLIDPLAKSEEVLGQISDIDSQLLSNQTDLKSSKQFYQDLKQQLKLSPQEALAAATLSQDPSRVGLLEELQNVERQIAVESARFTSSMPAIQTLEDQRRNLQNLLDQKTQKLLGESSLSVSKTSPVLNYQNQTRLKYIDQLVEASNQINVLEVKIRSLTEAKQNLEEQSKQLPKIANQYTAIDRQIALTNEVLDKLLMQRETLKVEAAQELPWQLISKPQIPMGSDGQPIGEAPGRVKTVLAGVAAGLFLGALLAFWLERRKDVFHEPSDFEDILSLPVLGEIPHDEEFAHSPNLVLELNESAPIRTSQEQARDDNDTSFLEAFEKLYAQLSFVYEDMPINSLVVSSVEPEDGQSTVALYLAKTIAKMGKRVLLVDANFRNPQIHDWLNLSNYGGLYQLLNDSIPLDEVVHSVVDTPNLSVLTAGISQSDPSIRLWSSQMQNLMEDLHSKYDVVIYDAPKFLDSTDTSFLSAHTNGMLMVVSLGKTSQAQVKKAVERSETYNLTHLGIVANHAQA
jgi:polysaccharide biosynthesis transport protein